MTEENNNLPTIAENVFVLKNTFAEHGNEIEDIISKQLPFIVRWGTMLLFFFLILVVVVSWVIKYPDIITTPAKLTSINAAKPVITIINGKLIKLSITENQSVSKNQVLGFIESTGDHAEVILLSAAIDSMQRLLDKNQPELLQHYFEGPLTQLGELQTAYQTFAQSFFVFKNYLTDGFYLHKKICWQQTSLISGGCILIYQRKKI